MGTPDVISYFDDFEGPNEWAALSNFFQGRPIQYRQYAFATGEHMFQGFKATNKADLLKVIACATPAEAKQQGKHTLRLRGDWERVKYDVMRLVLACKFAPGREESAVLLGTGDALLIAGTTWGDQVWGVDLKAGRTRARAQGRDENRDGEPWEPGQPWPLSPGRNWLGVLLMARRAELLSEVRGAAFQYDAVAGFAHYTPVQETR
jgi:ribA/ribD-fused uncharacterized protein